MKRVEDRVAQLRVPGRRLTRRADAVRMAQEPGERDARALGDGLDLVIDVAVEGRPLVCVASAYV